MSEVPNGQKAGAMLEASRRARGLDLGALAAQLKVPVARLEALEAGNWQLLPSGPYARGLATAVCRALQMDAGPVLAAMPGAQGVTLDRVAQGINQPFRGDARPGTLRSPWLWLALVLIAGVTAVLLLGPLPGWQWLQAAAPPDTPAAVDTSEPVTTGGPPATPLSSASVPVPSPASALAPSAQASTAALAVPAEPTALTSTPAASVPAPVMATGLASVRIAATQASWVNLTDARGREVLSRLVVAGEALDMNAEAPVRLTLGNAPGVSLRWRGQDQDLSAYAKLRVARLELQ